MKLALFTLLAAAIVATCLAKFVDESTVNETCDEGCNSKLKVTLKVTGLGKTKTHARHDCKSKCAIPGADKIKTCGNLCNLDIPVFASAKRAFIAPAKTCALCGGDPGKVAGQCQHVLDRLETDCKKGCEGTPFYNSDQWLAVSSRTTTQDFPGDRSQCNYRPVKPIKPIKPIQPIVLPIHPIRPIPIHPIRPIPIHPIRPIPIHPIRPIPIHPIRPIYPIDPIWLRKDRDDKR